MQTTRTENSGGMLSLGNNVQAYVHRWLPAQAPRAALMIIHGMAEHGGRYDRLAQTLTAAGIAVFAQDLPGHGLTAGEKDLGHMGDRDAWAQTLDCINAVHRHIERSVKHVPVFVLGHSMGGYLLQHYVADHSRDIKGAIFSASSGDVGALRKVGLALLRLEGLLGPRWRSRLGEQLSFKDFNRRFKPARTDFDWLSRDAQEVDRYIADPLCGFRCSCATWKELLTACGQLAEKDRLGRIRKELHVMLIAGSADAAVQGERGVRTQERLYMKAGLKHVAAHVYPGGRHELLNDTCRDEVTQDLLQWIEKILALPPPPVPPPPPDFLA